MARQRGALDRRLLDLRAVTAEFLDAVMREHDCSGQECTACGYRPTRRQKVCRSVEVARGLRCGRAPRWAGDETDPAHEISDAGQDELFAASEVPKERRRA